MLHPARLAATFAGIPSAPGTPVHSIQTMRRKAAGHSGPLTKILVANRGVRLDHLGIDVCKTILSRKLPFEYSALRMNLPCIR
jgi:hypothetical protein